MEKECVFAEPVAKARPPPRDAVFLSPDAGADYSPLDRDEEAEGNSHEAYVASREKKRMDHH